MNPNNPAESCDNCKFSAPAPKRESGPPSEDHHLQHRQCRRGSPNVLMDGGLVVIKNAPGSVYDTLTGYRMRIEGQLPVGPAAAFWPVVPRYEWCGEYKLRTAP